MRKGLTVSEIIHFMAKELKRALSQGMTWEAAERSAVAATHCTFPGERLYVAALPKQQHAVQLAKLNLRTTREMAEATGLSVRQVRRILRGR